MTTEQGEDVRVVCPDCGDDLCYDELVPRTLGMSVVRLPDGSLEADPDPDTIDEASWEGSETQGIICRSCASQWAPAEAETINQLLARVGVIAAAAEG